MDDPVFQEPSISNRDYKPTGPKSSRKILVIVLALILVAVLAFGATRFTNFNKKSPEPTPLPSPTEIVFPTDTPTPTELTPTPSSKATPTITPRPTVDSLDKQTGLNRANLSVAVQNGSGQAGVASKASEYLKSFGYKIISSGNADNFNYEKATILIKEDKNSYLPLLKKDLSESYSIGSTSATLSASSSADAVVIIGK